MLHAVITQSVTQNRQIKHYTFHNFHFHFHYWFISKNILVKAHKPYLDATVPNRHGRENQALIKFCLKCTCMSKKMHQTDSKLLIFQGSGCNKPKIFHAQLSSSPPPPLWRLCLRPRWLKAPTKHYHHHSVSILSSVYVYHNDNNVIMTTVIQKFPSLGIYYYL